MLDDDEREEARGRLIALGLLRLEGDHFRTTRAWQGAMARAALRLLESEEGHDDVRIPIAVALVERCGAEVDDHALASMVETMLEVEELQLTGASRPPAAPSATR